MSGAPDGVSEALAAPLRAAQSHADAGRRVVGFSSPDIPVELIRASGAFALQLPVTVSGGTPDADRYVETTFSPQSRSIAQQFLRGEFDFLDTLILSRANDSFQRLYYYLCELQRRKIAAGPRLLIYDLAKIPRPVSVEHSIAATRRLARDLGSDAADLPAAVTERNRRRRLFDALDERRRSPAPPAGSLVGRLLRASDMCEPTRFDEALQAWLQRPSTPWEGPRVLLAGSEPPDDRLHEAVEAAGGCIVAEVGDHALRRLGAPVTVGGDPLRALALQQQTLPVGPRSFADRAGAVAADAARYRTDGVIFWIVEEDESLVWSVPDVVEALAADGIPLLCLTRRRWDCADGALDAIHSFVTTLQGAV